MLDKFKEVGTKLTVSGTCCIVFSFVQIATVHWCRLDSLRNASHELFNNMFIIGSFITVIGLLLFLIVLIYRWITKLTAYLLFKFPVIKKALFTIYTILWGVPSLLFFVFF